MRIIGCFVALLLFVSCTDEPTEPRTGSTPESGHEVIARVGDTLQRYTSGGVEEVDLDLDAM